MAATTAAKRKLSGSTNGKAIKVVATATAGTLIHTATATSDGQVRDEVYLWARNSHTADVLLTIEDGGATDPDDLNEVTIPFNAGWVLVEPGMILDNGLVIRAFAATGNVITIRGWVNRITQDAD